MTDPIATLEPQQQQLAAVPLSTGRVFGVPPDPTLVEWAEIAAIAATQVAQGMQREQDKRPKFWVPGR